MDTTETIVASTAIAGRWYRTQKNFLVEVLGPERNSEGKPTGQIRARREGGDKVVPLPPNYLLTPLSSEDVATREVDALAGLPRDRLEARLPSLADAALVELARRDTRMWLDEEIRRERDRRAARILADAAPAAVVDACVAELDHGPNPGEPADGVTVIDAIVASVGFGSTLLPDGFVPVDAAEPLVSEALVEPASDDAPSEGGERVATDAEQAAAAIREAPRADVPPPKPASPRGWCLVCGRAVSVRAGGMLREHRHGAGSCAGVGSVGLDHPPLHADRDAETERGRARFEAGETPPDDPSPLARGGWDAAHARWLALPFAERIAAAPTAAFACSVVATSGVVTLDDLAVAFDLECAAHPLAGGGGRSEVLAAIDARRDEIRAHRAALHTAGQDAFLRGEARRDAESDPDSSGEWRRGWDAARASWAASPVADGHLPARDAPAPDIRALLEEARVSLRDGAGTVDRLCEIADLALAAHPVLLASLGQTVGLAARGDWDDLEVLFDEALDALTEHAATARADEGRRLPGDGSPPPTAEPVRAAFTLSPEDRERAAAIRVQLAVLAETIEAELAAAAARAELRALGVRIEAL